MDFDLYRFDTDRPAIANQWDFQAARQMLDEAKQAHHEAEENYCKWAGALHSPEVELRYTLAKRQLSLTRGLLAEIQDVHDSHI